MDTIASKKEYVGDGVYVERDHYGDFIVTTENGWEITNRVVLEPSVAEALVAYMRRAWGV